MKWLLLITIIAGADGGRGTGTGASTHTHSIKYEFADQKSCVSALKEYQVASWMQLAKNVEENAKNEMRYRDMTKFNQTTWRTFGICVPTGVVNGL